MTVTINNFIKSAGITMTAEYCPTNPYMEGADKMDNWRARFRTKRRQLTIYFSMGRGLNGKEPTAAEVLDCLASDAAGFENADNFEDWCDEYGYNTDSRKAERTFKAVRRQSTSLRRFLGENAYSDLLWNTKRE